MLGRKKGSFERLCDLVRCSSPSMMEEMIFKPHEDVMIEYGKYKIRTFEQAADSVIVVVTEGNAASSDTVFSARVTRPKPKPRPSPRRQPWKSRGRSRRGSASVVGILLMFVILMIATVIVTVLVNTELVDDEIDHVPAEPKTARPGIPDSVSVAIVCAAVAVVVAVAAVRS